MQQKLLLTNEQRCDYIKNKSIFDCTIQKHFLFEIRSLYTLKLVFDYIWYRISSSNSLVGWLPLDN